MADSPRRRWRSEEEEDMQYEIEEAKSKEEEKVKEEEYRDFCHIIKLKSHWVIMYFKPILLMDFGGLVKVIRLKWMINKYKYVCV